MSTDANKLLADLSILCLTNYRRVQLFNMQKDISIVDKIKYIKDIKDSAVEIKIACDKLIRLHK